MIKCVIVNCQVFEINVDILHFCSLRWEHNYENYVKLIYFHFVKYHYDLKCNDIGTLFLFFNVFASENENTKGDILTQSGTIHY